MQNLILGESAPIVSTNNAVRSIENIFLFPLFPRAKKEFFLARGYNSVIIIAETI